jgi:chromate reductase
MNKDTMTMTTVNSDKNSDDYDDFLSFVGGGAPLPPPPHNEASPAAPAQVANSVIKILGLSGSLRAQSTNSGLLRHAMAVASSRSDVVMTTFNIGDLPLFNADLVGENEPAAVKAFRAAVADADAFFFACPEYNYSMTAAMKNALDWPSNPSNDYKGKVGAVVGAGGGAGTARAQLALRHSALFLDITMVNTPEVCINRFAEAGAFDQDGNLVCKKHQEWIADMLNRLVDLAKKFKE